MAKKDQLNTRLDGNILAIFNDIAKQMNLSPGTLGTQVITQWVEFYYYKIQRGDVILSKQILSKFLDAFDKKRIDEVAKYAAKVMIDDIKTQEGSDITYQTLVDHILKWNKGNHLIFNKIEKDDSDMFISKHSLGYNWSELESKTYAKVFQSIGQTVINTEFEDGIFSFEVIRHKK